MQRVLGLVNFPETTTVYLFGRVRRVLGANLVFEKCFFFSHTTGSHAKPTAAVRNGGRNKSNRLIPFGHMAYTQAPSRTFSAYFVILSQRKITLGKKEIYRWEMEIV